MNEPHAIERLYPPMGHNEIGQLAQVFTELLTSKRMREFEPDTIKQAPRWTGPQVAQLLGVSLDTLYRRLKKEPSLPQGTQVSKRKRTFQLDEIHRLQDDFQTRRSRRDQDDTLTILFGMFKGGVSKTTSSVNASQGLVLRGKRGLFVDCDPQASASLTLGAYPAAVEDKDTILPVLVGRVTADGEPNPDWTGSLLPCIRKTHWSGLDLLPANLSLFGGDFEVALRAVNAAKAQKPEDRNFYFHRLLADALNDIRKAKIYDFIMMDTPPSLGFLNTIAIYSAEVLVVPVPPAPLDMHSAAAFFQTLAQAIAPMDRVERVPKIFEAVVMLVSKYKNGDDDHEQLAKLLRDYFPDLVLRTNLLLSAAMEKSGFGVNTPYEMETYAGDKRTLERALECLNSLVSEIEAIIHNVWDCRRAEAQQPQLNEAAGM